MKIRVTEEHIMSGKPGKPCCCPVAMAITEAARFAAYVHGDYVHFPAIDHLCADLPEAAQKFIRDFDDGLPVDPFSFEVELP